MHHGVRCLSSPAGTRISRSQWRSLLRMLPRTFPVWNTLPTRTHKEALLYNSPPEPSLRMTFSMPLKLHRGHLGAKSGDPAQRLLHILSSRADMAHHLSCCRLRLRRAAYWWAAPSVRPTRQTRTHNPSPLSRTPPLVEQTSMIKLRRRAGIARSRRRCRGGRAAYGAEPIKRWLPPEPPARKELV